LVALTAWFELGFVLGTPYCAPAICEARPFRQWTTKNETEPFRSFTWSSRKPKSRQSLERNEA
jgi:hypothetical protein